jgi:succinate-acetate transporter protein
MMAMDSGGTAKDWAGSDEAPASERVLATGQTAQSRQAASDTAATAVGAIAHVATHDAAANARFGDPTPLGLIGLAMGCAALLPIAFGAKVGPAGLITAAVLCALFGGGCQLLAGLMNLANKNVLGGTLFTAFAFNWALNAWALWSIAHGTIPDHQTLLATEAASLLLFVPLTYAFGHHSSLLFAFMLDIDAIYALKLVAGYGHVTGTELPIAIATLLLGVIAIWLALAMLVNPVAGRTVFPIPGPLFRAPTPARG